MESAAQPNARIAITTGMIVIHSSAVSPMGAHPAFASQHLRLNIDMQRAKWIMISVLYPGYRKPGRNGNAMGEPRLDAHAAPRLETS